MKQLTYWTWHPIRSGPRRLLVICCQCQRGAPNEVGWLRRAGWQQSITGGRYRCGQCASAADSPDDAA